MSSRKRARTNAGSARTTSGRSFAYPGYNAERRSHPAAKYMRQYIPRSATTRATYGLSRSAATPTQLAARDAAHIFGRGRYSVGRNWRRFSQSVGLAGAGRALLGAGVGAATRLIGMGGYEAGGAGAGVAMNSLMSDEPGQVFSSEADETGAITVSRREYVTDIFAPTVASGGAPFTLQAFSLNPGLEQSFPWLSQIAQNYEEFEFKQLVWSYRSTTADVGTTTSGQCGTVIMATNYNAAAPNFVDKVSMMEYDGSMSCKTTDSMMHGVECDPLKLSGEPGNYVRANAVPLSEDLKTYDHGKFQIAVVNTPAGFSGQGLGELWVSYTVVLRKPKFFVARGLGIGRDIFVSGGGPSLTTTAPMGSDAALLSGQQNNIGCTIDLSVASTIKITFPPGFSGNLEVVLCLEGFGFAGTTPFVTGSLATTGNVALIADMYAAGGAAGASSTSPLAFVVSSSAGNWAANAANGAQFLIHVRISPSTGGVANTLAIVCNTLANAVNQASLDIHEYNAGFSTRALGIGSTSAQSDAPILVNKSGAVVTP